ncbi:glycosyltransferase family 1 protein [Salipaludibacillus sp. HK11]|uniref:glycosyltransferase family 1 protein n=1 Tax=Salipaludibacillus sp. HK11 TaxID=3394320 RepID=UPI0039FBC861
MKRKLKILQVTGAMNRAGTETMLMNIYRNVDQERIQFDFISYSDEDADYDYEIREMNGRVIKLKKNSSIFEFYQVMKKFGPYDAVHSHTLFHCGISNFSAFLAGVNVRVAHAHTTSDEANTLLKIVYMKAMRVLIKYFSTHLLACSQAAGQYLFGEKTMLNQPYSYFPNLIPYKKYLTVSDKDVKCFKKNYQLEKSEIVIGHIGRFIEAKNHMFLFYILKKLVDENISVCLLLIGDGNLKEELMNKVKEMDLSNHVRFAGLQQDVNVALHSMDVFVFPSLYEGLGLVLLEAQASGLPCIVSDAIQPEADLGLGLVTTLSLSNTNKWTEQIKNVAKVKELDNKKITDAFESNGFSTKATITKLQEVYQSTKEDA